MKTILIAILLLFQVILNAQVDQFKSLNLDYLFTASPSTYATGNVTLQFTPIGQVSKAVFIGPVSGGDQPPTFRLLETTDIPFAVNTTENQTSIGEAKTFTTSLAISGTSGNTFALETSGFVYDATNGRIGINNSAPSYLFDMIAPSTTG